MKLKTLDQVNLNNKSVLLRIDINSPVEKGKVIFSERMLAHSKTILEISKKGAKLCILAHQGRKGKTDFVSLQQHAFLLNKILKKHNKKIIYVNDLFGKTAISKIKQLKPGEIILLKNTRTFSNETDNLPPREHSKSSFVSRLAPLFDLYVQDALSTLHRSHASVTGFPYVLDSCIGLVLEKELKAIKKLESIKKPTYVLGGAKPSDYVDLVNHLLKTKKFNKILGCGLFAQSVYASSGFNFGKQNIFLEQEKALEKQQELVKFRNRITLPIDFAVNRNNKRKELNLTDFPSEYEIFDIGKKTIKLYKKIIKSSSAVFIKGTPGYYLDKKFIKGTKTLFQTASQSRFSVLGGGDTTTAIKRSGLSLKDFSDTILAGGALLDYLAGKSLPGLDVLKKYITKHKN